MNIQIIFKNGRSMYLDDIESFDDYGEFWEVTDTDGNKSYIMDEILYIGRPEILPHAIEYVTIPEKKKRLFGL